MRAYSILAGILALILVLLTCSPTQAHPNDLAYILALLRGNPETAPCVQWAEAHRVRFNQEWAVFDTYALRPQLGWYAYPPDQVVYPPSFAPGPETAALIIHELGHLYGYGHPDVFALELWAAKALGVQDLAPILEREADYRAVLGYFYRPLLGYSDEGEPAFMSFSAKALNWRGHHEVLRCREW